MEERKRFRKLAPWSCTNCGMITREDQLDRVEDPNPPFPDNPAEWSVCPNCRWPENFERVCDHEYCVQGAVAGTPVKLEGGVSHYVWSCSGHRPRIGELIELIEE